MSRSPVVRRGRAVGALLMVAGAGWVVPVLPAGGRTPPSGAPVAPLAAAGGPSIAAASVQVGVLRGSDHVTLLAQSPWVSDRHDYRLRLRITAHDPTHERLSVIVYSRLTTRTDFDNALAGHLRGFQIYPLRLDLTKLPADPAGGVDVDIPVNAPATNIPTFGAVAGSAVFPVQVGLDDESGNAQGEPLTTYMVYSAGPPSVTGLPKLSVSLTLPIHSAPVLDDRGQVGTLPADQSRALADLVDALSIYPAVRLSLAVTPQALDAMAASDASPVDRSTLLALERLVRGGRAQVLPQTYVSVPLRGWDAAGLGSELIRQLTTGAAALARVFGAAPSPSTWVVNGSLDDATLQVLGSLGARQLILPDVELSALPDIARETTFARSTPLAAAGAVATAYGADTGLTADFSNPGGPVLAANQLLAELAMIQLETPGNTRGVAVLPPPGWPVDPTFVETLLAGLNGHPLLNAVSASGLFGVVQVAPLQRSVIVPQSSVSPPAGSAPTTSGVTSTIPPELRADIDGQLGQGAAAILSALRGLAGLAAVLPQDAQVVDAFNLDLLVSESSDLSEIQRQGLLDAIKKATDQITGLITLPRSSSITLTATRGQIPITVLSAPSLHPRVELRLSSPRLIFHLFSPSNGKCRVPTPPTSEVCDLTLTTRNTTLKVPVETRSSGVFPMDVSLWTPDGSRRLAVDRNTVRSTAVSGVGVALIVAALLFLVIWWVRDMRHGRRARQLVPVPGDDGDEDKGAAGPPDGQVNGFAGAPGDSDPAVRDFFATPPPRFEDPPSESLP